MRYDSIAPLMDPVFPLEVSRGQRHSAYIDPQYRQHRKQPQPQKKSRYQRKPDYSWPIDPDDLSRRLLVVVAERESTARREARRRSSVGPDQALRLARDNRAREAGERQAADQSKDTLVTRARKVLSMHAPPVEPPRHDKLHPAFFRPRSAAVNAAQPLSPIFGPNRVLSATEEEQVQVAALPHRPATSNGLARASHTDLSSRNFPAVTKGDADAADGHYVPRVAAAQFAKTATADSMLEEPCVRQNARRVSTHPGHHDEATARPGKRRSMFEHTRGAPSLDGRSFASRRMSTGALLDIPERPAGEKRGYFEAVNDHRVDWTQTDEEGRKTRPWKILRKVDSLFHLSSKLGSASSKSGSSKPGSRGSKDAGDAGSLGSTEFDGKPGLELVDENSVSPKSQTSKSFKAPRLVKMRSFWPFRS